LLSETLGKPFAEFEDVCELLVSEVTTNAIMHSASGDPGGVFTVLVEIAVTDAAYEVTVHAHDAGPTLRDEDTLRGSDDGRGHGLNLIAELSDSNGRRPSSECSRSRDARRTTTVGHCGWMRFIVPLADALEACDADL
jgi:hypothetical protein